MSVKLSLGKYELVELLGTTSLASVYKGYERSSGKEVAVKMLRPYFREEEEMAKAFFRELEGVLDLAHPNIVPLRALERDGQSYFLVMDYIPGPTLDQALKGPLEMGEAKGLIRQIGDAVDYAHSRGIIHLDIKPYNIFVGEGKVLVSDFKMARLAEAVHPLLKESLNTPSPAYSAPEVAKGVSGEPRSDIYSMGVLLYQMLTGALPFHAVGAPMTLAKQLTSTPLPPSRLNPRVSKEVDRVVLKAMARNPDERYRTAREMMQELDRVTADIPVQVFKASKEGAESQATQVAALSAVGERWACPYCGHSNVSSTRFCEVCWTGAAIIGSPAEAELKLRKVAIQKEKRLRRIAIVVVLVLLTSGIGSLVWSNVVNEATFLSAPASDISSTSSAGEWAVFQYDIGHTGVVPGGIFSYPEGIDWSYSTSEPMLAAPVVADGKVYLATGDRRIVALNQGDGSLLWDYPVTGPVNSSPAVAGGRVFVGLRDWKVLALDAEGGTFLWDYTTDNPVTASPVVHNGVVYIGSGDGHVYALDAVTGKKRWASDVTAWVNAAPSIAENIVVVPSGDERMHFLDIDSGKRRQAFVGVATSSSGTAAIVGDTVYMGDGRGRLRAIDLRAKEYPSEKTIYKWRLNFFTLGLIHDFPYQKGWRWTYTASPVNSRGLANGRFAGSPAVADGVVYIGATNGRMYAVDAQTGKERWVFAAGAEIDSAVIVVGDVVVFGTAGGELYALSRDKGEVMWRFTVGGGVVGGPVFAGGTLYVASQDGNVYALR